MKLYFLALNQTSDDTLNEDFLWVLLAPNEMDKNNSIAKLKCIKSIYDLGRTQTLTSNSDEYKLLKFYIDNPNRILHPDEIENCTNIQKHLFTGLRSKIKDKFLKCSNKDFNPRRGGDRRLHNANNHIFNQGLLANNHQTIFDFSVAQISQKIVSKYWKLQTRTAFGRDVVLLEIYEKWKPFNHMRKMESKTDYHQLLTYLTERYPNNKQYLYQVEDLVLPFIVPDNNKIQFPIGINYLIKPIENKHEDSLLEQRQFLGSRLYNGHIYRLLTRDPNTGEMQLACCRYFETLDSADYLSSRLKAYYQKSQQNPQEQESLNRLETIWNTRMSEVVTGDFSYYNASLGFSLPIFRILENNKGLQLLHSKGSSQKAVWAAKKQICPSGALEYWSETDRNNQQLTFEIFKTIATKELFEEVLLGSESVYNEILHRFPRLEVYLNCLTDKCNPDEVGVDFNTIRESSEQIVRKWDEIWEKIQVTEKQPNLEPLFALQEATDDNAFFIIDALNYRPEIVLPLYINSELNALLNWEYDKNAEEIVTWRDVEELDNWLKDKYKDWSIPSLAAAYLGAKWYFDRQPNN